MFGPLSISTARTSVQGIPITCLYCDSLLIGLFASIFFLYSLLSTQQLQLSFKAWSNYIIPPLRFLQGKGESLNWPIKPYMTWPLLSFWSNRLPQSFFLPLLHASFLAVPWIHQAHLPQDLCTCYSPWLGHSFFDVYLAHTLTFSKSLLKYYLTREAFPDHPCKVIPTYPPIPSHPPTPLLWFFPLSTYSVNITY